MLYIIWENAKTLSLSCAWVRLSIELPVAHSCFVFGKQLFRTYTRVKTILKCSVFIPSGHSSQFRRNINHRCSTHTHTPIFFTRKVEICCVPASHLYLKSWQTDLRVGNQHHSKRRMDKYTSLGKVITTTRRTFDKCHSFIQYSVWRQVLSLLQNDSST